MYIKFLKGKVFLLKNNKKFKKIIKSNPNTPKEVSNKERNKKYKRIKIVKKKSVSLTI